jgi:hypothetical protein
VPVPDPFTAAASGTLACEFSLTPARSYSLRTTVHWSLNLDLGDFVPGFVEDIAESLVAASMDPSRFGATALGDHAFAIDRPLPAVAFGGSELRYTAVRATPAGMTIGGPVRLPLSPSLATLRVATTAFGLPSRLQLCSILAKSGSGDPIKGMSINDVTTNARIFLENAGRFCAFEIIAPGGWIASYIRGPAEGTDGVGHDFYINVPSAVALGITSPSA